MGFGMAPLLCFRAKALVYEGFRLWGMEGLGLRV